MKILTNLNLSHNMILNAALENLTEAPANPVAGQVYFNTINEEAYVYNGTNWISLTTPTIGHNTALADGIVPMGSGNAQKVWKTDSAGNPAWRDDSDTKYTVGSGISLTGTEFSVSAGNGLTQSASGLVLGTPSSITATSTNSATATSHTHSVTFPVTSVSGRTGAIVLTSSDVGLSNVENKSSGTIRGEITSSNVTTALGYTPLNSNLKGSVNGLAELDGGGKVPSTQLPSYVDDVLEYASTTSFPITGESGKIYIAIDTNKTYRWTGTGYAEISSSLALGETSATAYRGDRGKTAYDHSQLTSGTNPHGTTFANVASKPTTLSGYGITDAAPSSHTHTLSDITDSGSIASINTNGSTANYLRGDGSWVTPPNTTYSVISTAEIDAGTATTARTISGARVKYILDKKANASHTHLPADIAQDTSNRFVTEAQIAIWNAKGTSNLTLGTTSSTAYRGDYGNTAYTHSQSTHAPTNAQANQTLTSGNGMSAWTATSGNLTISLGTPSSITSTSTNSLTSASHTHALGDIDCGTF